MICHWTQEDYDSDTWNTTCGRLFSLIEGTPQDNDIRFCCFCSYPVMQNPYREEDDEIS